MGKTFYLLTYLAQMDPQFSTAADTSRRAILESPQMKLEIREVQRTIELKIYEWTNLTPEELAYVAYGYPLLSQRVSSKPFKNFKYKNLEYNYVVVPEIEYHFDNEYSISAFIIKEF